MTEILDHSYLLGLNISHHLEVWICLLLQVEQKEGYSLAGNGPTKVALLFFSIPSGSQPSQYCGFSI
jgi:hypothetical protein